MSVLSGRKVENETTCFVVVHVLMPLKFSFVIYNITNLEEKADVNREITRQIIVTVFAVKIMGENCMKVCVARLCGGLSFATDFLFLFKSYIYDVHVCTRNSVHREAEDIKSNKVICSQETKPILIKLVLIQAFLLFFPMRFLKQDTNSFLDKIQTVSLKMKSK